MLYVLLEAGSDTYALATDQVEAIVPFAALKHVPGAPAAVVGLLNYHGTPVPVIDFGQLLAGQASVPRYSTRIILYRAALTNGSRLLGLLGENITRTEKFADGDFVAPAARAARPACVGPVVAWQNRLVQLLKPEGAIPEEVLETILAGAAA